MSMRTTLHSGGSGSVSVHDVAAIAVSANSRLREDGSVCYWQDLSFFDGEGLPVGTLTLFLARPEAALPVGDQPPYWGVDPRSALAVMDGEPPF